MLEELIKDLMQATLLQTEALKANTAAILKGGVASTGPSVTVSETPTTAIPATEPVKVDATVKPKKVTTPKVKAPEATSLDDLKQRFGQYLAGVKGEEKASRVAQIQEINRAMDVERVTLLEPDRFDEALGYLDAYIRGEEPDFGTPDGDEDDASVV